MDNSTIANTAQCRSIERMLRPGPN